MKIMLIDDERLALSLLERMIGLAAEKLGAQFQIKKFHLVEEALEQIGQIGPEAVFLDIHMPEISGLQAAEIIQEKHPSTLVVFVTAYDEYAVRAFELNAIDYVLKPFTAERVEKTVQRIAERGKTAARTIEAPNKSIKPQIRTFKTVRFQSGEGVPELPKWRTAKAQELFAYLLHRRGEIVHKSAIMELLSPELDQKRAMTQLYTAIYQIRQCIRQSGLDITISNASIQEGYILHVGDAIVESEKWESSLSDIRLDSSLRASELGRLLDAYEGDYLGDHDYVWAENERERLRQLWLQHARLLSAYLMDAGELEQAQKLLERLQTMDPYHEGEGIQLLDVYEKLGHYDKVIVHYKRLKEMYGGELGIAVPAQIESWFRGWRSERGLQA